MFQTFTGNTRRPRQVNLSGKSSNPFAANGLGGPQGAIDLAREDRARRQQERERLQASSRIQRTWRGHTTRRKTFRVWRSIWDEAEHGAAIDSTYPTDVASLSQLNRLALFFSPETDKQDLHRLNWYGRRQISTASEVRCTGRQWEIGYSKLRRACLAALRTDVESKPNSSSEQETLNILTFATVRAEAMSSKEAVEYYTVLASVSIRPSEALQHAILAPLPSAEAYAGLLLLLSQPQDPRLLLLLSKEIDSDALALALTTEHISSTTVSRERLWLLSNMIYLCGIRSRAAMDNAAQLLGSLALEVDFEGPATPLGNVDFDREVLSKGDVRLGLNTFLAQQVAVVTSQDTIRNLLLRDSAAADARVSANMALTLLRCFPRKADDIRMWLYLGPTTSSGMPSTQYFWQAMERTSTFNSISNDSRGVLNLLSPHSTHEHKDDWTVIMVFLELYTFLIKIIDDEEFLGRAPGARQSAISVHHIASLVTFLKNLGFTLCFNISELNKVILLSMNALSLESHTTNQVLRTSTATAATYHIAGIPGMDIDYLKGVVTGLLRAIYERDSRRHFLSADHWLMTSRFDMTAFIPAVVQEEENRHMLADQDDDDDELNGDDEDQHDDNVSTSPVSHRHARSGSYAAAQARTRAQKQASRQRYLEAVTPRLEILQNMPFFIPFTTRVEIFRQFILLDQAKRRGGHIDPDTWRANMMFNPNDPERNALARRHANIKRKSEFRDAYNQFADLGADLKEPIQITFWDEHGLQEAGIDGGGVTKEFLTSVIDQAFHREDGSAVLPFFKENDEHLLYPNPTILDDLQVITKAEQRFDSTAEQQEFLRDVLRQFEFLGRIIGKCLYEGILVDVTFAGFFLKKWALFGGRNSSAGESGYRASINDLRDFDEALYRGLLDLKNAPDASEFGLNFTVDDIAGEGATKEVLERQLIPNGAATQVTNENRLIYINRMSWYRLQGQSAPQTRAFLLGLSSIIEPSWLSMFNQAELQTLIGGASSGVDVQDLRHNTQYGGTYSIGDDGQEHPSVKLFWTIMQNLPDEDRQKVLKFVTSTPRGPLLGFAHLNPRFSIRDSGSDENRFPTTSTCVNLLKLPMYKSEAVMRRKLLEAVNSGAGFDLS